MLVLFCIVDVWMISEFHSHVENEIFGIFLTTCYQWVVSILGRGEVWGLVVLFDSELNVLVWGLAGDIVLHSWEGVKMGTDIEWLRYPAHPMQGHIEVFLINHVMLTKETSD